MRIASISDIDPSACTIMQSKQGINYLEKIKALNTRDEFETEGKKIIDPFRLSENIHAYTMIHSELILINSFLTLLD